MVAVSVMLTADDIPWRPFVEPPGILAPPSCGQADVPDVYDTKPCLLPDYRDWVITELADGEAAALARVVELTDALDVLQREHVWTAEVLHVAVGMLARLTYERDVRLASQYRQARAMMPPDDAGSPA